MDHDEFWKYELHREVVRLSQALGRDGPQRLIADSVTLERFALITAYVMRKLKDLDALTLDVTDFLWPVVKYPCIQPPPHRKWFRISFDQGKTWQQRLDEHYDLSRPTSEHARLAKICDSLVHHFAFAIRLDPQAETPLILFNSDKSKDDLLYGIALDAYIGLVNEVADDTAQWVDMSQAEGRVIQRRHPPKID